MEIIIKLKIETSDQLHCYRFLNLVCLDHSDSFIAILFSNPCSHQTIHYYCPENDSE